VNTEIIKANLIKFYNREARFRNAGKKQGWKIAQRKKFCNLLKDEGKTSLLELGAGTGQDGEYFMAKGFGVTAVDISGEMVRLCKEKGVDAYEMDFYDLNLLRKTFDACWSMNSLLHVPRADLPNVLAGIREALRGGALFFLGVYGGDDREHEWANDISDTPRFFSRYTSEGILSVVRDFFSIVSYERIDVEFDDGFHAVVLKKG
jgi:SAM-dependent methyltransferase